MRIITGKYKGRKLYTPKDRHVRPTSDRVKEAIFSMLGEAIMDNRVLDLFAGTGSLGLESLSRGASHCVFVDNNRESIQLIKDNIAHLGAARESTVISGDYRIALNQMKDPFDLIFMDPPYHVEEIEDILLTIDKKGLLKEKGAIVVERDHRHTLPEEIGSYRTVKSKKYGMTRITFYQR